MISNTILFIHGMYMNSLCWEKWVTFFQARGYRCHAPDWPGRDRSVELLRKIHPDPDLGKLTLGRVVESYECAVSSFDEKPILIGHSMGGLVVPQIELAAHHPVCAAGSAGSDEF